MKSLGDELICSGLPWQKDGETAKIGINSLTAKVLCERHNNALSPADAAAKKLFTDLSYVNESLATKRWSSAIWVSAIRGELVELWALKTLMAIHYGGIGRTEGIRTKENNTVNIAGMQKFLAGTEMRHPLGMYITSAVGGGFRSDNSVSIAPLTRASNGLVCGVLIMVAGYDIKFVFESDGLNFETLNSTHIYRPWDLVFYSSHSVDQRSFILKLGWKSGDPHTITYEQQPRLA